MGREQEGPPPPPPLLCEKKKHIKINSIRNEFEDLKLLIQDNVDILVITETKLGDTFTSAQFYMEGFKTPIRLDRNSFGDGIVIIHSRKYSFKHFWGN